MQYLNKKSKTLRPFTNTEIIRLYFEESLASDRFHKEPGITRGHPKTPKGLHEKAIPMSCTISAKNNHYRRIECGEFNSRPT